MSNQTPHPLTPEDIARLPLPGMAYPTAVAFSPDDRLVTYLRSPDYSLENYLFAFDPQTGQETLLAARPGQGLSEANVSPEEALRRERQRQMTTGLTSYAWAEHAQRILIPIRGDLYVLDPPSTELRLLLESSGRPALDAQLSPDGQWAAYVQDGEMWVISCEPGGAPLRLTHTASATLTNGLAEFVAQEEMGRAHGFWWSPGSDFLAYEEADTSPIPIFRIPHPGEDDPHAVEEHRYPFAGEANARVRLGVISRAGGETAWMDLGDPEGDAHYLARVDWLPDGGLTAQLENRAQTRLELDRFDPQTGTRRTLLVETSPLWINLHNLFRPLKSGGWIWGSERTGFRHLYLYGADGALQRPLTAGEWMVDAVAGVDEDARIVYFTGSRESPTESQLYAVDFGGGEPRRLTSEPGMHSPVMDHACARFVDTSDSITQPPTVRLRSAGGDFLAAIFENRDPRLAEVALPAPEIVSLANRAGDRLYGAIFRPPERFGTGPHPTLVHVYGGPHVQLVQNSWKLAASLRAQYLASLGYLVFTLDNRGSARRGLAFEGAIHRQVGNHEVEDQVDGVRWLVAQGLADPQRVGIYGWSYGGYMSAMCLARAPETFRAAVAGAPVTHEAGYDTHYTERYMSTPQDNPEGYQASSVMTYVDEMRGQLLLVHGLIDENVHFRHTARLINALIRARKPYELLVFPGERHSPRRLEDRVYLEERVRDFFLRTIPL